MRGIRVCQPGFACGNRVADGRKSVSEKTIPWPPAGVASLGVVCPETDAPHGVKRAGFSRTFGASAQKVLFYGRVLRELGKSASEDGVFWNAVLEKASLLRHHKLLREVIRHLVHNKRRWGPLRKHEEGRQNSTTCFVEYSSVGLKTDGAEPSVTIWAAGSVLF